MKKLLSVLLALLMVFTLVGCGSTSDTSDDETGETKVAYILSEKGDTYSQGLCNNFKEAWLALGGEIAEGDVVSFPSGTTNFSDYLQKAMDDGADVIFAPNSTTVASNLLPNADDLGVECPILAGDTWDDSVIADATLGTELDVYCSTFFAENEESELAKNFVDGIKAWIAEDDTKLNMNSGSTLISAVSALGYDAYNVAYAAIEAAAAEKGTAMTSLDIATALANLEFADAVTGTIVFDDTGDAIKDTAFIKKANNSGESGFEFAKAQTIENDAEKGTAKDYSGFNSVALDTANKQIVIGVFEPTSGDNGAGGKREVLGIEYANSLKPTIEIDGEEYNIVLALSDNESKADNAASSAGKIVEDGAMVVLGSYGSGVSIAAYPTFEAAGIPAIGVSCTNASVTDGHDLYFRICFLDPFQGTVMANFAWELVD